MRAKIYHSYLFIIALCVVGIFIEVKTLLPQDDFPKPAMLYPYRDNSNKKEIGYRAIIRGTNTGIEELTLDGINDVDYYSCIDPSYRSYDFVASIYVQFGDDYDYGFLGNDSIRYTWFVKWQCEYMPSGPIYEKWDTLSVSISPTGIVHFNVDTIKGTYNGADYVKISVVDSRIDSIVYINNQQLKDNLELDLKFGVSINKKKRVDYKSQQNYIYVDYTEEPENSNRFFSHKINANKLQPVRLEWQINEACALDSASMYHVQVLRLYNYDPNIISPYDMLSSLVVDWNKALNLYTGGNKTYIETILSEGEGYYIWRVRPIGNYYPGGAANDMNWGNWAKIRKNTAAPPVYETYPYIESATYPITSSTPSYLLFNVNLSDENFNWVHNRNFTDDASSGTRQFDKLNHMDYLLKPRQDQSRVTSDNSTIVNFSYYDYLGRNSIVPLAYPERDYDVSGIPDPVPLQTTGLNYKRDNIRFTTDAFVPSVYDPDNRFKQKVILPPLLDGRAHNYYDGNYRYENFDEVSVEGIKIPSARGYPYIKNTFKEDGTNRIIESTILGEASIDNSATPPRYRSTKTFYSAVSQDELFPLFYTQTPTEKELTKTYIKDPNGVVTVSYLDQNGKPLATCVENISNNTNLEGINDPNGKSLIKNISYVVDGMYEITPTIYSDMKAFAETRPNKTLTATLNNGFSQIQAGKTIALPCMNISLPVFLPYTIKAYVTDDYTLNQTQTASRNFLEEAANWTTISVNSYNPAQPQFYTATLNTLDEGNYKATRTVEFKKEEAMQSIFPQLMTAIRNYADAEFHDIKTIIESYYSSGKLEINDEELADLYAQIDPTWSKFPAGSSLNEHNIDFYYKVTSCGDTIKVPYYFCGIVCELEPNGFEQYLKDSWGPKLQKWIDEGVFDISHFPINIANTDSYFYTRSRTAGYNPTPQPEGTMKKTYPASYVCENGPTYSNGNGAFNAMIAHMLENDPSLPYPYSADSICDCWKTIVDNEFELAFSYDSANYRWMPSPGYDLLDQFLNCAGRKITGFASPSQPFCGAAVTPPNVSFSLNEKFGFGYLEYAYKSFCYNAFSERLGSDRSTCERTLGYTNYVHADNKVYPLEYSLSYDQWQEFFICQRGEIKRDEAAGKIKEIREGSKKFAESIGMPSLLTDQELIPECVLTAIQTGVIIDEDCINQFIDMLEDKCRLSCDSKDFEARLRDQIRQNGGYIQGGFYVGDQEVDPSSLAMLPRNAYDPTITRVRLSVIGGGQVEVAINKYFKTTEFNNYVKILKNNCNCNCELTLDKTNAPSNDHPFVYLNAMGSEAERKNWSKAMTWDYDVKILRLFEGDTSINDCAYLANASCGEELISPELPHGFTDEDRRWYKLYSNGGLGGFPSDLAAYNFIAGKMNSRLAYIKSELSAYTYNDAYLFANSSFRVAACEALKSEFESIQSTFGSALSGLNYRYSPTLDEDNGIMHLQIDNTSDLLIPSIDPLLYSRESIFSTSQYGMSYNFKNTTGLHADFAGGHKGIRNDEWTFFPVGRYFFTYGFRRDNPCVFDSLKIKYNDLFTIERDVDNKYYLYLARTWEHYPGEDPEKLLYAPYEFKLKFLDGAIEFQDGDADFCNILCYRWKPFTPPPIEDELNSCGKHSFRKLVASVYEQYDNMVGKYVDNAKEQLETILQDIIREADGELCAFKITEPINYTAYTLYYYDRGGNLQYTVPPEGVDLTPPLDGSHKFVSNTITTNCGAILSSQTPEEKAPSGSVSGRKTYIYDKFKRIRFTQDARQKPLGLYSYIKYDKLGRIVESGEVVGAGAIADPQNYLKTVFINDAWPDDIPPRTYYTVNVYDAPYANLNAKHTQHGIRNKLSYSTRYNPVNPGAPANIHDPGFSLWTPVTTVYSYDPMGHVEFVMQLIRRTPLGTSYGSVYSAANGDQYDCDYIVGTMHYEYDYVGGNINMITYNKYNYSTEDFRLVNENPAQPRHIFNVKSKFYQKYEYDSDSRLIAVYTSRDSIIWERDAKYFFYPHGPQRISEIGTDGLTRNEYLYTPEGWSKAMNAEIQQPLQLVPTNSDGQKVAPNPFSYTLNYYLNDFVQDADLFAAPAITQSQGLFNGSIRSAEFNYRNPDALPKLASVSAPAAFKYSYDLLYRLKSANFRKFDAGMWYNYGTYDTDLSYDLNGNILSQTNLNSTGLKYDHAYSYDYTPTTQKPTNKLTQLKDSRGALLTNYQYDNIGNLTNESDIPTSLNRTIVWTYDGKVAKVYRPIKGPVPACTSFTYQNVLVDIRFLYDASGARVAEIMNAPGLTSQMQNTTNETCAECLRALNFRNAYYVRRETGDIISVYHSELVQKKDVPYGYAFPAAPGLTNNNYYNRNLGPNPPAQDRFTLVPLLRQVEWDVYAGSKDGRLATAQPDAMANMHAFYRPMGYKTYEMKDWLGTPRLTYSDIKRPDDPTVDKFYYTYKLDYLSATTTYPFGAEIEELSFENSQYRFGFTGHLKDNIIRPEKGDGANYSTLFREYDPIIGRWWSIDPKRESYVNSSPYNYVENNPIDRTDLLGDDWKDAAAGFGVAMLDNATGLDLRGWYKPTSGKDYNLGQNIGDATSISLGGSSITFGGGLTSSSLVATAATSGFSIEVTGPTALLGVGIAAEGTFVVANGTLNLFSQKGRVPEESNSGSTNNKRNDTKRKQRAEGKAKREDQPASEKRVEYEARKLEKAKGKGARRKAHDAKRKGEPDRTLKQIKEDYKIKP